MRHWQPFCSGLDAPRDQFVGAANCVKRVERLLENFVVVDVCLFVSLGFFLDGKELEDVNLILCLNMHLSECQRAKSAAGMFHKILEEVLSLMGK